MFKYDVPIPDATKSAAAEQLHDIHMVQEKRRVTKKKKRKYEEC